MNFYELIEHFKANGMGDVKKADDSYVRVMSSNVLHTSDRRSLDPEAIPYEERMDILCALYLAYQPDFLGVQEVSNLTEPEILQRLDSVYAMPKANMGDYIYHRIDYQQNATPIFYNKHKFELIDTRFHLFNVKGMWSYQWALYASKKRPGKKYIHMNLHFYPEADERQLPGVEDAHYELIHLRRMYPKVPIFLTGDYNMLHTGKYFEYLFEGLNMTSGMLVAEKSDGILCHNHDLNSTAFIKNMTAIDHASVTTDLVDVKLHRILLDEELCKTSDHCPMFIDVKGK